MLCGEQKIMNEGLKRELDRIRVFLQENSIRAFATGSRVQGIEVSDSDLDIVVLDDVDTTTIEDQLEEMLDSTWPVDVVQYSQDDLEARLKRNDPFVVTMIRTMEPLTISDTTTKSLRSAALENKRDTEYIEEVERLNKERAIISLCHWMIYSLYRQVIENGYDPVPPRELPNLVDEIGILSSVEVERILNTKRQAETGDCAYSALTNIIEIIPEIKSNSSQ